MLFCLPHSRLSVFCTWSHSAIGNGLGGVFNILFTKSLAMKSPVQVGKNFEMVSIKVLKKYGFSINHCGGPKDKGVDFRGQWKLANYEPFSVVGQCKKFKRRLGPRFIREMEGVLSHEQENCLGILVTELGYTKDAYQATMSSHYPIILTAITRIENINNCAKEETDKTLSEFVFESSCCSSVDNEAKTCHQEKLIDACSVGFIDKIQTGHKSCSDSDVLRHNGKFPLNNFNTNSCVMLGKQGYSNEKQSIGHDFLLTRVLPGLEKDSNIETEEDISNSDFVVPNDESVRLSLFEMNHKARQLLPFLIIGTKYDKKNSRIPELLFIEGDDIHEIKD